jgi:hypothetical protein
MPAHLIIERGHDGPKLLQTYETREEAEEARSELIEENPEESSALYILIAKAVNASSRHPA